MNLYLASDHGGLELKKHLITYIEAHNLSKVFTVVDLGPFSLDTNDDYTDYTFKLAKEIQHNPHSMGILICRSGIGVSIAANKAKGIYAALCSSNKEAKAARQHNNANVLCLDADYGNLHDHVNILDAFLTTQFSNDARHVRRINEIKIFEQQNMRP